MSAAVEPSVTTAPGRTAPRAALLALLVLFTLSGAAGLIYETVWFQLLRLTIGGNAQSLGVLLACFMGGLFLGSVLYARVIPQSWHPLRTYAVFEFLIAVCGLILPYIVDAVRDLYFSHATSPQMALLLRSLICTVLLGPPTVLMGATLPALARWIRADQVQSRVIGGLYSARHSFCSPNSA